MSHHHAAPPGRRVNVPPGGHYATREKLVISTLLGSCVASCLYDPVSGVAGMNHFLLANPRYTRENPINVSDAGRYGIHAMELLINAMMKLGGQKKRFKAKVFGGGNVLDVPGKDALTSVGEVNNRFIAEFLKTEHIPIVSTDLGGSLGRVIHFHTDDFQVYRRFIPRKMTLEVEREEEAYWKRTIAEQQKAQEEDIFLFD